MADRYDVVVVGGGPAGYVAAIRCAQLGLNTACIDDGTGEQGESALGGTCLNVGCIPSKALLESSELFAQSRKGLEEHGIRVDAVSLDLDSMMARKRKIVAGLTQGIAQLFKANGITRIQGHACLQQGKRVEITPADKSETFLIEAQHIILAPGSSPVELGNAPLNEPLVVDSSGALVFDAVPQTLGIIGAGVIGLELGSVWKRLGAKQVTLFEAQDAFLPFADAQVAKDALRSMQQQGLDIKLDTRVTGYEIMDGKIQLAYQNADGDQQGVFDKLIVAVGRRPNTQHLASDESELLLDEWGFIHVDEQCRTNLPDVYAIGDAVRGPMLAHKGSEEGIMAAELIAGHSARVNYQTIPSVIYTHPEIAWVGETEQALKNTGVEYHSGVFPFVASGRARAQGETSGFVKILSDASSDRILGVHIIGAQASELVAQAVIAMELGGSAEDIAMTVFAHPTLSEAFHEAALASHGRAIHIAGKKRS